MFISTQGINGFFFPDYQDKVFCLFFRGVLRGLVPGLLIALASGIGVALSVLGGNAGSLVGVAISASLLPPAVNAVSMMRSPLSYCIIYILNIKNSFYNDSLLKMLKFYVNLNLLYFGTQFNH